ncbi:MAG: hypothetical protein ABIR94_05220 [Rubrivivax sp.]
MKKSVFSKKIKAEVDVVTKEQPPNKGPVKLDPADLKQVSGGLPKGSWGTTLAKGSWGKE